MADRYWDRERDWERGRRYRGEGVAPAPWFIPFSSKYAWGGERIEIGAIKLPELLGSTIGLTAGASTPNNKIGETVGRIAATRGVTLPADGR